MRMSSHNSSNINQSFKQDEAIVKRMTQRQSFIDVISNSGFKSYIFGEVDELVREHTKGTKPKDWKNIPIPVVEAIESILDEFDLMMGKMNRNLDGMKRLNKRLVFDINKMSEIAKTKEER